MDPFDPVGILGSFAAAGKKVYARLLVCTSLSLV
jgi:hypothetical protein